MRNASQPRRLQFFCPSIAHTRGKKIGSTNTTSPFVMAAAVVASKMVVGAKKPGRDDDRDGTSLPSQAAVASAALTVAPVVRTDRERDVKRWESMCTEPGHVYFVRRLAPTVYMRYPVYPEAEYD